MNAPTFRCARCGATLDPPADARLLTCPYCSCALALSGQDLVQRQVLAATVSPTQATAHLRRFLAGRETIAGLDREAQIGTPQLTPFPLWSFHFTGVKGTATALLPATASALQGITGISIPGGATVAEDASDPLPEPEIPLATARQWLVSRYGQVPIERTVLTYLPLYRLSYQYRGHEYHAAVDAVTGRVLPADFPAKREAPFYLIAAVSIAIFMLIGLLLINPLFKLAAFAAAAVPLWFGAWWVARHV